LSVTDDTGVTPDPKKEATGEKPAPDPTPNAPVTGDGESIDGLRTALKSERDARKTGEKRARELETRLRELEDRDKSESEKLASRASESERRATEAEAQLLRLEVAAARKMNAEDVPLLHGTNREEIEASADQLAAFAKRSEKAAPGFDGGARREQPDASKKPEDAHAEWLMAALGRTPSR
jgi:hypothetical protein